MKRLLSLLLVMGMVECGQKENAGNAVDPSVGADEQLVTDSAGGKENSSNANAELSQSTPAADVDPVSALEKLGAAIERNEEGEVVEVSARTTLFGGKVTDAGLVHLKRLTNLQQLFLGAPKITDAGLLHLTGLTKLIRIDLATTQITDAGVAELKKALPNCDFVRGKPR